ncbi:MAG TPA: hypothetical protein VNT54_16120 [Solirubrobacteraceae bacterium]|nr:hypothetical protein [Solirubrobacteraceae bacterium]
MPKFAGASDPVRLSDRLLVEWVAQAKPGDPLPEPWCQAHSPLKSMVTQLVELGVIAPPAPGTPVAQIAREATAAAKAWLAEHPAPPPQPDAAGARRVSG